MEKKVEIVSKSYDKTIELSRKGIFQYGNLPNYITENPMYPLYQKMLLDSNSDSGSRLIKEFLEPKQGMKFIDIGCCLNLIDKNYQIWDSLYYGIDVSEKIIQTLEEYIKEHNLVIGDIVLGNMKEMAFSDEFFDIGACIGSLEYYKKEFIQIAIREFNRVLKKNGRFVLDIPNFDSVECKISMMIEEYLGRKDEFDMHVDEFEELLNLYFDIIKKEIGDTIQYYLRKKD